MPFTMAIVDQAVRPPAAQLSQCINFAEDKQATYHDDQKHLDKRALQAF